MLPDGFVNVPEFLTVEEEGALLDTIRRLDFREFGIYGVTARGPLWMGLLIRFPAGHSHYRHPAEFEPVRNRAAMLAGIEPAEFAEALVTEYQPGAGIRWHRDAGFRFRGGHSERLGMRVMLRYSS
jgi:alkylated DNA repair dioxygenase AlkB